MESELRRVAGIILGAPLTRRTRHELLYCLTGGLAGICRVLMNSNEFLYVE